MQLPPLSVLATYPKPNYVNPETRGASLLVANCTMMSVSLVVVGIRIYTRVFISNSFGADDIFILLALVWIFGIVGMSAATYVEFGGTRHVWDIVPGTVPKMLQYSLATQLLFGQAVTFVKISMLLLTHKIMGTGNKILRNIIIFGIVYVTVSNIAYNLVMIFQCKPVSAQWTLSFKPQECINVQAHFLAASIINVVSDFLVVLIPIPIVAKLKMKSRQRAVVIGLFSTGFMICIVGIVRTYYGSRLADSNDFAWDAFPVYISGAVELYVGLICASVGPTRAFFSLYAPRLLSSVSSSSENTEAYKSTHSSWSRRSNSKDLEKGIQLSELSNSKRASPPPVNSKLSTSQQDQDRMNKGPSSEVRGVDGSDRKTSQSAFDTDSGDEGHIQIPKVWRGGRGPRGKSVERVESQTNLIESRRK